MNAVVRNDTWRPGYAKALRGPKRHAAVVRPSCERRTEFAESPWLPFKESRMRFSRVLVGAVASIGVSLSLPVVVGAQAGTTTISGRVLDAIGREPLQAATVAIKGAPVEA